MTQATVSHSNTKLGSLIHSWSIPAGKAYSCPGESCLCRTRCYAKAGFFRMPTVSTNHKRNFEFSRSDQFVDWMSATITADFIRVMRIHVSGDFYSNKYTNKWIEIVKRNRDQQFFAYTRSWRIADMLPDLVKLSSYSNMQLWWSIDRATGPAPLIRGVRRAYMAINDVDAQNAPNDCDLVFRTDVDTVMKKANGVLVCPTENGVDGKVKITCSACKLCFKSKTTHWEDEIVPYLSLPATELSAPLLV